MELPLSCLCLCPGSAQYKVPGGQRSLFAGVCPGCRPSHVPRASENRRGVWHLQLRGSTSPQRLCRARRRLRLCRRPRSETSRHHAARVREEATAKIIKAYPGLLRSCGADLMCGKSHIVGAFSKVDGTAYRPMETSNLYWLGYMFGATPAEAPQLASFQRLVHLLRRPKDTTHSRVGQPRVTEHYDDDDDVSIVAGGGGGVCFSFSGILTRACLAELPEPIVGLSCSVFVYRTTASSRRISRESCRRSAITLM